MDRNTVIALVLSAIVLLGWGYLQDQAKSR